jgi:hypothetical protein
MWTRLNHQPIRDWSPHYHGYRDFLTNNLSISFAACILTHIKLWKFKKYSKFCHFTKRVKLRVILEGVSWVANKKNGPHDSRAGARGNIPTLHSTRIYQQLKSKHEF